MKRVIVFLLAVSVLSACSKSSLQPANPEVTGQVLYGGDPAADGIGYIFRTDSTHETLSLQNLPAEYKHTDVNVHAAIRFFDMGATLHTEVVPGATGPRMVVLRSIRKV